MTNSEFVEHTTLKRGRKMEGLQYLVWGMGIALGGCVLYTIHGFLGWVYS